MGRQSCRGSEESSVGIVRRFLFDENVTPIGRALANIYPTITVSQDTEGLGRGADDEAHIIPWCRAHDAVWVTKDWRRRRNREMAKQLYKFGVSVAWFRPHGKREWTLEQLFTVAANAMPRLIEFYSQPGTRYAIIDHPGRVAELPPRLLLGDAR